VAGRPNAGCDPQQQVGHTRRSRQPATTRLPDYRDSRLDTRYDAYYIVIYSLPLQVSVQASMRSSRWTAPQPPSRPGRMPSREPRGEQSSGDAATGLILSAGSALSALVDVIHGPQNSSQSISSFRRRMPATAPDGQAPWPSRQRNRNDALVRCSRQLTCRLTPASTLWSCAAALSPPLAARAA
jgi:hypothetical protein